VWPVGLPVRSFVLNCGGARRPSRFMESPRMTEVAVSAERKNFSKIRSFMDLPNLIDVQRRSYERFLQMNLLPEEREDSGLQSVFTSVFPFSDFRGACELQFVKYSIGNWEC